MRRLLALIGVVGGAFFYLKRRRRSSRERVHLYYDDGSMVSLEPGAPQAERLLALARAAL
jgi:hypothetical protein